MVEAGSGQAGARTRRAKLDDRQYRPWGEENISLRVAPHRLLGADLIQASREATSGWDGMAAGSTNSGVSPGDGRDGLGHLALVGLPVHLG